MKELPKRKTEHLHRGRSSIPHARYFITVTTDKRERSLSTSGIQDSILLTMERLQRDGDITNLCATIMPDHIHWLFELGDRLSIGRVISKWKVFCPRNIHWQRDFFEHRLRPFEDMEYYGRYIFMNSSRAKLVSYDRPFTGTRIWTPRLFQFTDALTTNGGPQPEWLAENAEHPVERFKQQTNQSQP